jgi:hypothetical protein
VVTAADAKGQIVVRCGVNPTHVVTDAEAYLQ